MKRMRSPNLPDVREPNQPLAPISGKRGELVDRFIQLLNRESDGNPGWWNDFGSRTLLNFSSSNARYSDRSDAMKFLRNAIEHAISEGVAEDLLIQGLKRELDEVVRHRADAEAWRRASDDLLADDTVDQWRRLNAVRRLDDDG